MATTSRSRSCSHGEPSSVNSAPSVSSSSPSDHEARIAARSVSSSRISAANARSAPRATATWCTSERKKALPTTLAVPAAIVRRRSRSAASAWAVVAVTRPIVAGEIPPATALSRMLDAVAQHLEGLRNPARSRFLLLGTRDPLRVLAAMREGARLEGAGCDRVGSEPRCQLGRDLHLARSVVSLDLDDEGIAVRYTGLAAQLVAEPEPCNAAVDHQPAAEGDAVHGAPHRRPRLPVQLGDIERNLYAAAHQLCREALHNRQRRSA